MRPSLIVKLLGTVAAMGLLAVLVFAWQGQGQPAAAQSTIDQISIDMSPDDVHPRVTPFVNGDAAVGDRDANGQPDAEGAADQGPPPGIVGVCGNGIDDDQGDWDFSGTVGDAPGEIDGVADDGCVATLSVRQTCANISNNNILDADEDAVDRIVLDVTVGQQPGTAPGSPGGIPTDRPMTSFQFNFNWDNDVMDLISRSPFFLITAAGTAQPFSSIVLPGLPATTSPATSVFTGPPTCRIRRWHRTCLFRRPCRFSSAYRRRLHRPANRHKQSGRW